MENKINVARLLKNCPSGMELDCTLYENVTLIEIREGYDYPIVIETPNGQMLLSKYGCFSKNELAKCIIFPKGKTTWAGFHRPVKDGDVVFYDNCVSIFKEWGDATLFRNYVKVDISGGQFTLCARTSSFGKGIKRAARFATEEEKAKLFQAIKDSGYKWNEETKTLEKLVEPRFKVGDEIVKRNSISNSWIVSSVSSEYYGLKLPKGIEGIGVLPVSEQDDWELVHNKFDINTLKPFDKMLCRQNENCPWIISFFGFYDNKTTYPFICSNGFSYKHCIPYEGNKHLLGTIRDCDEYYKNW